MNRIALAQELVRLARMVTTGMSPSEAKKLVADRLRRLGIEYTRLSAKTIGFSDLARGDGLFVTIHGWKPNPAADEIKKMAKENGFFVQFD